MVILPPMISYVGEGTVSGLTFVPSSGAYCACDCIDGEAVPRMSAGLQVHFSLLC